VVYAAKQTEPVRRRVALKVIKLGMDTRQVIAGLKRNDRHSREWNMPTLPKCWMPHTDTGRPYL